MTARFKLIDREVSAEPFHYLMSGLDDVYLLNGFRRHNTDYGDGVSIENAAELHKAIGMHLILHRKALGPKDIKFLRKNMKLTQEEMAKCISVTGQTIARYEKGETEIPGPVDKLVRFLYGFSQLPAKERNRLIDDLAAAAKCAEDIDETEDAPMYFLASQSGWDMNGKAAKMFEFESH